MKIELSEKTATIFQLEAREKAMKDQLRATEEEFAAKTQLLRGAETALIDKQAELAKLNHDLSDKSMVAETRQVELITVRAQSDAATRELAEARERVENLNHRVTDLDRQLMLQVKEAEMLNGRIGDLE